MNSVIIKKVDGHWVIDGNSQYVFEGEGGAFDNDVYQEVEVSKITPIKEDSA